LKGNPWGIFILEFRNPDVFATGRGMTGTLRKVLRGLVPSKKKRSSLASFRNENLLFICNHDYKHYRFAHFKTPDKNCHSAPLAAFGWGPGDPTTEMGSGLILLRRRGGFGKMRACQGARELQREGTSTTR